MGGMLMVRGGSLDFRFDQGDGGEVVFGFEAFDLFVEAKDVEAGKLGGLLGKRWVDHILSLEVFLMGCLDAWDLGEAAAEFVGDPVSRGAMVSGAWPSSPGYFLEKMLKARAMIAMTIRAMMIPRVVEDWFWGWMRGPARLGAGFRGALVCRTLGPAVLEITWRALAISAALE